MSSISFATWQFVRLMVRLEETRARQPARDELYEKWRADWERLDAELERLREKDFDAFSDLMMEHDITFEGVAAGDLKVIAEAVEDVAAQLGRARKSDGRAQRKDLDFEAGELEALGKSLRAEHAAQAGKQ